MLESIIQGFDIWTDAQGLKSKGRVKSVENIRLEGIDRLRELILELAFIGKLCANSTKKSDFDKILVHISKKREQFHKERNVRIQKFEPLKVQTKVIKYHSNWTTAYFNDVILYITDFQANGSFASLRRNVQYYAEENYAVLVRLTDLRHNLERKGGFVYTDKKGYDFLSKSFINGGELVVANVGAGVGTTLEVPVMNRPATLAPNMFMIVLSEEIDRDFFKYYSKSPFYWEYINEVNVGTGQPKINKREYKSCKIPFPPLEEQQCIVAKVNEFMAFCDTLEKQQTSNLKTHQLLVRTILETLTQAADANESQAAWERMSTHFDTMFCTEDSIDQLKQTILQLAVMGRLVPQDLKDEPASELLKKIAVEKERLMKEGKIKKQNSVHEITEKEKSFNLPIGWTWAKLQDIVFLLGDGLHGTPTYTDETNYYFINGNNLNDGKIEIKPGTKTVSKEEMSKYKKALSSNTVLVSINGTLGKVAFYNGEEIILGKSACYFNLSENVFKCYIKVVLESKYYMNYAIRNATGTTIKNLGLKAMNDFPIPLPSLPEQHRIAAKVDELFAVCDALKAKILKAEEIKVQLAEAVVECATAYEAPVGARGMVQGAT
jgi:type I restriction enzyme, S subunit